MVRPTVPPPPTPLHLSRQSSESLKDVAACRCKVLSVATNMRFQCEEINKKKMPDHPLVVTFSIGRRPAGDGVSQKRGAK